MLSNTIQTTRLILRPFTIADVDDVQEYASDPEVCQYMVWGPNTIKDSRQFIQRATRDSKADPVTSFQMAVVEKSRNKVIGGCGYINISHEHRKAEIGYCLHREFWNRGYGTEAAAALLHYGFTVMKFHRISGRCDVNNTYSERIFQKLNMQKEGLLREYRFIKGKWINSFLYSILESEYNGSEKNRTD